MTTGLRETSSNLFICKCGCKAFAVGIDLDMFQIFGLLCLHCGTDYAVNSSEEGEVISYLPLESMRVLH
jgi:hypothetical protein